MLDSITGLYAENPVLIDALIGLIWGGLVGYFWRIFKNHRLHPGIRISSLHATVWGATIGLLTALMTVLIPSYLQIMIATTVIIFAGNMLGLELYKELDEMRQPWTGNMLDEILQELASSREERSKKK